MWIFFLSMRKSVGEMMFRVDPRGPLETSEFHTFFMFTLRRLLPIYVETGGSSTTPTPLFVEILEFMMFLLTFSNLPLFVSNNEVYQFGGALF